jgi:phage terminase large subunit
VITLTQKQSKAWLEILENPAKRRILFDGGARSTKTSAIVAWLATQAATYPGALILLARKHRNACDKSIYEQTLKKLLAGRREWFFFDSDMEVRHRNGSVLRCDGLDDADRVDKVLGTEYDHIFFNEATQLSWPTVTTVLTRLARNKVPVRKAFFDCNPKSQRHWLYKVGIRHVDPDTGAPLKDTDTWARQNWTPYDNPHLPSDVITTLEALTGVQRRRMLLGEWCDTEGAVYSEDFREDLHVHRGPMPAGWQDWRKCRSIDFGYTNPFCCLWGAIDPDGRLWIYRERYLSGVIVADHARAIRQEPGRFIFTTADHDAEDRATLHANGIETIRAKKQVGPGINAVKARLRIQKDGRSRLKIHESCQETISEFFDYAWPQPKEGRNAKEEPEKDRDHAQDALRYMVMELDGPPGSTII